MPFDTLALAMVFAAVFFYVLYGVIRAAVRDGILQADERRQKATEPVSINRARE
ncbi:hypothetical protein QE394_001021 [Arthrobacter sp. SORGH_AS 212]|uniref:hypothetical protein n=1 Tax=Pseudarthrobacter sp. SORGH_AS 212 TaxID=3041777 RepID=UPI002782C1E1|nr:hypothetical protein [Arthrobacter sp. SORGH_AS_0212]